jgi:CelD/BcsL family acetyltransferase involved in cellulose biosynthesis
LRFELLRPEELDPQLYFRWVQLHQSDLALSSPFFHPEFTLSVGRVRRDVRVLVISDHDVVVGFFPFQAGRLGLGRPVGGALSDFHGIVGSAGLSVDPVEVLRACGLCGWSFDHLVAGRQGFETFGWDAGVSPAIDLSRGFNAYCMERSSEGTRLIKKLNAQLRSLEKDHGPVTCEWRNRSKDELYRLMNWKSMQCNSTGTTDVFGVSWTRQLLIDLSSISQASFAGMLSTMAVGGHVVAAHFGMRSASTWHYWFPSYDVAFAKYSPGLLLLVKMAEAAPGMGLTTIDLGKGDSKYKSRFANNSSPLLQGFAATGAIVSTINHWWRRADEWVNTGSVAKILGLPVRACRWLGRQRKYY